MARILVNLDVDDMERAVAFYTQALELELGRRFDNGFVELLGAEREPSRSYPAPLTSYGLTLPSGPIRNAWTPAIELSNSTA